MLQSHQVLNDWLCIFDIKMKFFKVKHIFIRKHLPVIADSRLPTPRRQPTLNGEIKSDLNEHAHRGYLPAAV